MSQYWAGRGKITSLQAEQEYLKRMINSLTSHSILHDDYCGFVLPSQYDKSEKVKGAREGLSLSNEKYMDLVVAHCNSLRGEYADNYYGLFLEYTVLQKLYRSAVASIAVTRYHAQRLVIKAGRLYYPSPAVVLSFTVQPNPADLCISDFTCSFKPYCTPILIFPSSLTPLTPLITLRHSNFQTKLIYSSLTGRPHPISPTHPRSLRTPLTLT